VTQRGWDAATYDRVSDVQAAFARRVLDLLPLRGDETVLDAGCGSGRVTAMLLDRLPEGRVIGVDSSEAMIEHARAALGERAELLVADLTELELDVPVDAVFSNAVFHWVLDHDRLFERLYGVLRPGGRLVAQCGGEGNLASFLSLVDDVAADPLFVSQFADFRRPTRFARAEETAERLRSVGFDPVRTSLEPSHVTPEDPAAFLRTVVLGVHLERLPEHLRDPFLHAVLERCGGPVELDYVRLNIDATRP
jgi:trans-aconitate 2-methyltransferase